MDLEQPFPGGLQHFKPPCCPHAPCPSRQPAGPAFDCRPRGHFLRQCDRRRVRRFRCRVCGRSFSSQTFRLDYRLKKPQLTEALFKSFVGKVTQRQAARSLPCNRKTVRRRLLLLGRHSREFQERVLERAPTRPFADLAFQLDELETFESDRRLKPVTLPVLIHTSSRFVLHVEAAALPARGQLRARDRARREQLEARQGARASGSRAAVGRCFERLAQALPSGAAPRVSTDQKASYAPLLAAALRGPYAHEQHAGRAPRTPSNPLWPINHTLAMLRDGLSRLVRRSWGASKERGWLELHAWIWAAYRNYIRGFTNQCRRETSGQRSGLVSRVFTAADFFEWRVLPRTAQVADTAVKP